MIINSTVQSILVKKKIVLWVEDRLTAEYLSILWQPDERLIGFGIAGGYEVVKGVVEDLRSQNQNHVFGIIDRDFSTSNRLNWHNPNSNIFVYKPDYFEIENYLLDWNALHNCNENRRLRRTVPQIQNRAEEAARGMLWWMACRRVLNNYMSNFMDNFPKHPRMNINNLADAENYIQSHQWFISINQTNSPKIPNPENLSNDLENAYNEYHGQINNGVWIHNFSGKEIFNCLRGYLFNEIYASDETMNLDLATSIAEWQLNNNSVPQELLDLKDIIKRKIGLMP